MLRKNEDNRDLKENWPEHYYEIEDTLLRKQYLEEYLQEHPDHLESRRLLDIWNRRFTVKNNKAADRFMEAWMMLKIDAQTEPGFFNRRRKEKDLRQYADTLCLEDASPEMKKEWRDFAETLLMSFDRRTYRTAIFGMLDLGDKATAIRAANEIDLVTGIYPSQLGCSKVFEEFRKVIVQTYTDIIQDGEEFWNNR